jgi:molybdenum cofactor synthesis domain-containing protein|tara:strand:- start:557 stop:1030 length:474 start_codon:yes stop_codon:yes gene_type:complete
MKYIVVTVSDTSSLNPKKDLSGPEIVKFMSKDNVLLGKEIISDDVDKIIFTLNKWLAVEDLDLILTTGGTGIGPRDVTPEATKEVIDYEIPGIPELMRVKNYLNSDYVSLSRAIAGVKAQKLIINLPGSTKAVQENLKIIYPLLKHALELIAGNTKH